jgi:hypothetical protein
VWPQWQGAGTSSVRTLAAEFPLAVARREYAVGSAVLEAVLPPHHGPTAAVPFETGDVGLDGIEAKRPVVDQLGRALELIQRHSPARLVTLGGGARVGSLWSGCILGPKTTTPTSQSGASAPFAPMSSASQVSRCSAGWLKQAVLGWRSILTWTPSTATRSCWGWAPNPGGLTSAQVRRIVTDARAAADVVGFTVAEYLPRQVMHMQQILEGLPLISDRPTI